MTPFLKKLCDRGCVTATPDTPLQAITETMSAKKIGTVVILENDAIAGIVSERDIIRIIAKKGTIIDMVASDIMTTQLVVIEPDVNSTMIMDMMSKHNIRHVPIIDKDKLVGIVSITDVVRRISEKTNQEAEYLREFINS